MLYIHTRKMVNGKYNKNFLQLSPHRTCSISILSVSNNINVMNFNSYQIQVNILTSFVLEAFVMACASLEESYMAPFSRSTMRSVTSVFWYSPFLTDMIATSDHTNLFSSFPLCILGYLNQNLETKSARGTLEIIQ